MPQKAGAEENIKGYLSAVRELKLKKKKTAVKFLGLVCVLTYQFIWSRSSTIAEYYIYSRQRYSVTSDYIAQQANAKAVVRFYIN